MRLLARSSALLLVPVLALFLLFALSPVWVTRAAIRDSGGRQFPAALAGIGATRGKSVAAAAAAAAPAVHVPGPSDVIARVGSVTDSESRPRAVHALTASGPAETGESVWRPQAPPVPGPVSLEFPAPAAVTPCSVDHLRTLLRTTGYPNGVTCKSLTSVVHHHHQPNGSETVEQLQDSDVAYFIKACKKFNDRARAMYDHWAKLVRHAYFSTDLVLDGIPIEKQIITSLDNDEMRRHIALYKWQPLGHTQSCLLTTINTGRFLSEGYLRPGTKWLVFLDDDTFVIPHNLLEYLSVFPSAGSFYLGLSNAEVPGYFTDGGRRMFPLTATAPGVAFSRAALDRLRRGENNMQLSNRTVACGVCLRSSKDDLALAYIALGALKLTYVARPDLRGYHFRSMPDPTHLKPLTVHTELQDVSLVAATVFRNLQTKYATVQRP